MMFFRKKVHMNYVKHAVQLELPNIELKQLNKTISRAEFIDSTLDAHHTSIEADNRQLELPHIEPADSDSLTPKLNYDDKLSAGNAGNAGNAGGCDAAY